MKKLISLLVIVFTLSASAQQKQDSLIVQITMDTTVFKNTVALIRERFNPNSATDNLVLQNILFALYQNLKVVPREKIVSVKPKQ